MSEDFAKAFGRRVKEARLALGPEVTQEALADAMEVGFRSVQEWEQGRKFPRPAQIIQLCEITGRDANWFYDIDPLKMAANRMPELKKRPS